MSDEYSHEAKVCHNWQGEQQQVIEVRRQPSRGCECDAVGSQ